MLVYMTHPDHRVLGCDCDNETKLEMRESIIHVPLPFETAIVLSVEITLFTLKVC